jgi:hypothetical protein
MNTLHAVPAYGRSYETDRDLVDDWTDEKDFKVEGGSYFSIRDYKMLVERGYDNIAIKHKDAPISSVYYVTLFKL